MLSPCKTCRFFLLGEGDDVGRLKGECRKDPPKMLPSTHADATMFLGFWPDVVGEAPGCGEHRPVFRKPEGMRLGDPGVMFLK